MIAFPFAFISSAYVPVGSMPGWLHAPSYFVVRAVIWAAGIVAVFLPLAVVRYRQG